MAEHTAEVWLPVVGYEGIYEVSSLGRVKSLERKVPHGHVRMRTIRERILAAPLNKGYPQTRLARDGVTVTLQVHNLVTAAFLGPKPDGYDVCHYDGDRTNNRIENLRYDTRLGNIQDNVRLGTIPWMKQTHCKWGHELPPKNRRGVRECKVCAREKGRRRRAAKGIPPRPERWITAA